MNRPYHSSMKEVLTEEVLIKNMFSRLRAAKVKHPLLHKTTLLAAVLLAFCFLVNTCSGNNDWRTASRESAGLAPLPGDEPGAVIQVYAAPAWSWRGWFAVHTWIAAKPAGAHEYTVYEVIGWRQRQGLPVVRIVRDIPDRYWYGEKPHILADLRGTQAAQLLEPLESAAHSYPWPNKYKAFPGPNSNTFTAWIAREVPCLELKLPWSAIGSGYIDQ